jgi:hypothetical protein
MDRGLPYGDEVDHQGLKGCGAARVDAKPSIEAVVKVSGSNANTNRHACDPRGRKRESGTLEQSNASCCLLRPPGRAIYGSETVAHASATLPPPLVK